MNSSLRSGLRPEAFRAFDALRRVPAQRSLRRDKEPVAKSSTRDDGTEQFLLLKNLSSSMRPSEEFRAFHADSARAAADRERRDRDIAAGIERLNRRLNGRALVLHHADGNESLGPLRLAIGNDTQFEDSNDTHLVNESNLERDVYVADTKLAGLTLALESSLEGFVNASAS